MSVRAAIFAIASRRMLLHLIIVWKPGPEVQLAKPVSAGVVKNRRKRPHFRAFHRRARADFST